MATLAMTRGDRRTILVTVTDVNGDPVNLASYLIRFTAKRKVRDSDSSAVIAKSIGDGVTVTDAPGGLLSITIDPEDTSGLPSVSTTLVWDMQVNGGGGPETIVSGTLLITPDVTRSPN